MAILHGIEEREIRDLYDARSPWAMPAIGNFYGDPSACLEPTVSPTLRKTAFIFKMRLYKDPLEERDHRRNFNEDAWLRHKIHALIDLEDPKGSKFSLDDIFLGSHNLPTGLRQDEILAYYPNELQHYLQNKNYSMFINMGNPSAPQRMELSNPVITRLEKNYTVPPIPHLAEEPAQHRGMNLTGIDLEFEILCDSCTEVPHYNAATIKEVIKEVLKKNIKMIIPSRQETLTLQASIAEMKARATLRDMLSEKDYRKYLINGFVMVLGDSGKWYQIFMKQKHVRVYERGKFVKELCIHTSAKECPPTDHVLNLKIMVECDEQSIWDNSNLYEPSKKLNRIIQEESNIIDIFSKLKQDRKYLLDRKEAQRQRWEDDFFRDYA